MKKIRLSTFLLGSLIIMSMSLSAQGFQVTYPMNGDQSGRLFKEEGNTFKVLGRDASDFALGRISKDGTLLEWENNLGDLHAWSRNQWTSDGGWVAARKHVATPYDDDVELSKYDSLGNQEWLVVFGDTIKEAPFGVAEAVDGSFYILCNLWGAYGKERVYKVNAIGEVIWSKDLNLTASVMGILSTADGGCVAFFIDDHLDKLMKLSSDGVIEWVKAGAPCGTGSPQKNIIQTSDGGYIVPSNRRYTATTDDETVYIGEIYINRYDAQGDLVWALTYEDSDMYSDTAQWSGITGLTETTDRDFIMAGMFDDDSEISRAFLSKISPQGEILWVEYLNEFILLSDLKLSEDGNIYAIGFITHPNNSDDLLFLKANSEGVLSDNSLTGRIFQDYELDCAGDDTEAPVFHWLVEASGTLTTHYASSDAMGIYSMNTQLDQYELEVYPISPYWATCENNIPLSFITSPQHEIVDFPMQPEVICPWMQMSIGSSCYIRQGAVGFYVINYCNYGTAIASDVSLTVNLPDEAMILEVSAPYIQNGQNLSFNLDDVAILECQDIVIKYEISTDVPLGTVFCADAHLMPDDICLPDYNGGNPATDSQCTIVIGSYDPNNKVGLPFGEGDQHLIAPNEELSYTIQFQNTGTDTAFRVVLLDTLPEQLEISSFRPGASSHPYEVAVTGAGILKFTFDPIALVDSLTNEEASQGFVKYTINQKPDLPPGTTIANSAAIYFDFNAPVITEPWIYTIMEPNNIQSPGLPAGITLYPNPGREIININAEHSNDSGTLAIYNPLGRLIVEKLVPKKSHTVLPIEHWDAGLYYYYFRSGGQVLQTGKLMKY